MSTLLREKSRKGQFWRDLLKILLVTVLLIAALETASRLWYRQHAVKAKHIVIQDPVLNHKWRPNIEHIDPSRSIPYVLYTNGQSFVERRDIPPDKPADTLRVFYVGDSNVQGVVSTEKKMVRLVEKGLDAIYQKKGKHVEVINTGTTSYSPMLYYLLIKNTILNYSPDLVVINVDMTDVADDVWYKKLAILDQVNLPIAVRPSEDGELRLYRLTPKGITKISRAEQLQADIHNFLSENSALYFRTTSYLNAFLIARRPAQGPAGINTIGVPTNTGSWVDKNWTKDTIQSVNYTMYILVKTIELLRTNGVKVFITGVPHYPQYNGDWSPRPHAVLRDVAKSAGIPYLDSYGALKNYVVGTDISKYYWSSDPTHFNEEGNALWARIQTDFIFRHRAELLP